MAEINIPGFDAEKAMKDFNEAVRETVYVVVGLGILGFQRAQVQRVELTKQLESQLTDLARSVDETVAPTRRQFEEQLDRFAEVLPEVARELMLSLRGAAAAREQAVRTAVGLA